MNLERPWLLERATMDGDGVALVFRGESWSWSRLACESESLALRLAGLGVGRGGRVALRMSPHPRAVALLHACQRIGAALVPLNLRLTSAEARRLLEHADPGVFLADEAGTVEGATVRTLHAIDDLDAAVATRHVALDDRLDPAATLMIVYTSGTTAAPKGVELTSASHAASAAASRARLGHGSDDAWLATLPLYHVGGLAILTRSVLEGSRVLLEDSFDAARVAAALREGEATMVSVVPTMLARILDLLDGPPSPRLRALLVGGAALSPTLARRALDAGLPVAATYGLTEACSQVCTSTPGSDDAVEGSVGAPFEGTRLRIEDADDEGIGEVFVRGPGVMRGYFRNEEASAAALRGGWLATGDLGRLDERGRLHLACRRLDLVVSGGENVAPPEVEAVLEEHPSVTECAVFGIDDPEWGHKVVALVAPRGEAPRSAELAAWCRARLAAYKTPREFRFVHALARNATGKIDRRALHAAWPQADPAA